MCDCAETMAPGDQFVTREGIWTVVFVTESHAVGIPGGGGAIQEVKYKLTDIHHPDCPDGGIGTIGRA
jgi:hypothetical protein